MNKSTPTSLYRYYDSGDVLIYVGITGRGMARNAEHDKTKEWWEFVARQEIDHLPSRAEALVAERKLILKHRPPFNRQHNPDHAEMRATYLRLRSVATAGRTVPDVATGIALSGNKFALRFLGVTGSVVRLEVDGEASAMDLDYRDPKFCVSSGGRKAKLLSAEVNYEGRVEVRVVTPDSSRCTGGQMMTKRVGPRTVMKRIDLGYTQRRARSLGK